jgi:RNA polymerase sigma-70 factor (ECF subfamily)
METYRDELFAFAMKRLRNEADALDAVQETFLRALRRIDTLRDSSRLRPWLMTIAYRVIVTKLRTRRVSNTLDGISKIGPPDRSLDPVSREEASRVREAMSRLRPLDRATLEAYYFDGLSTREMADKLSVPLGTVKRRLHLARQRLGDLLGETK